MEDDSQPCGLPQEDAREPEGEGQEEEGQEGEDTLEVRRNIIETLKLQQRRLFHIAAYIHEKCSLSAAMPVRIVSHGQPVFHCSGECSWLCRIY